MDEGEQGALVLVLHAQIVEAALARRDPVAERAVLPPPGRKTGPQRQPARPEQTGMALLVAGMGEEAPAQLRIAGEFGGAHQIAPAIRFHPRELEQLARAATGVGPHEPIERTQHRRHRLVSHSARRVRARSFLSRVSVVAAPRGSKRSCRLCIVYRR